MTDRKTRKQAAGKTEGPVSDEDRILFREMVGETRPVTDDRVLHRTDKPEPRPRQAEASERQVMAELLEQPGDLAMLETGEELLFLRTGLQQRVLKRLRRGHYSVDAELDLHEMNAEAAKLSIDHFIHECHDRRITCAKIIHGKGLRSRPGGPVLKSLTNATLRRRKDVMAFASARPNDGGTGAVYVLLKAV
jgi:DNA-nicking Smr family endonuclease